MHENCSKLGDTLAVSKIFLGGWIICQVLQSWLGWIETLTVISRKNAFGQEIIFWKCLNNFFHLYKFSK